MFSVIFDPEAIKFLDTLPKPLKERIFNKILSTKDNPFLFFEKLSGRGDYKLRVGDYRVIADIIVEAKRIEVTIIGHRKNIYQNL